MTDLTATPETGTVDAPASMDSILAEFEAGETGPSDATAAVAEELVEEAEEGQSAEEADAEDDATDAADEGEETAEEESQEGEEQPEPTYKVKVAGEEVEVPLSELLKGYSREQDYSRKTMALADQRRTLEANLANELKQRLEVFEATDPILHEAKHIDWQRLSQEDPTTYVQLKAAVEQRQALVTETQRRIEQARQGQTEAEQAQAAEVAKIETESLITKAKESGLADLSDPEAMTSFASNAVNYLRGTGYEDGEIAELTDHRALLIVEKARRYDELQKARSTLPAKKVVPKSQVKPLRTDSSSSSSAPKPRFPTNAPRERQLEHVVNQFLKQE